MRLNNISNINFQKRLVAEATIVHNAKKEPAKIYLLDNYEDKKELDEKLNTSDWKNSHYASNVIADFMKDSDSTYVMENKNGKYVGICQIDENIYPMISYIETVPKGTKGKKEREYKYIGETFLTYFAKKAKAIGEDLAIRAVRKNKGVKEFYFNNCHFEPFRTYGAILQYDMLDDLINQNVSHTGNSIVIA